MKSMIHKTTPFLCALTWGMLSLLTVTATQAQDLTGVKCVTNGTKSASVDSSVDYKGGKVYFCCDHCADTFRKDVKLNEKAVHNLKANHQLVLTGQYVQKGCPMSGKEFDPDLMTEVGGVKIGFCNAGCMNQVKHAGDLAAKSKFVFQEDAFKRAFSRKATTVSLEGVKCLLVPKKDVVREHAVDYQGGQVFFCCGGCAQKFVSDTKTFATAANRQLALTGQYIQTGCPISGGPVDEDQTAVVGGLKVRFCCGGCKSKIEQADDEAAQAELVFGAGHFEKAFKRK